VKELLISFDRKEKELEELREEPSNAVVGKKEVV